MPRLFLFLTTLTALDQLINSSDFGEPAGQREPRARVAKPAPLHCDAGFRDPHRGLRCWDGLFIRTCTRVRVCVARLEDPTPLPPVLRLLLLLGSLVLQYWYY